MSKIGKTNISIPEKVKVALAGNILNIEGPLGKKSIDIDYKRPRVAEDENLTRFEKEILNALRHQGPK